MGENTMTSSRPYWITNGQTVSAVLLLASISSQASGLPEAFDPVPAAPILSAQASFSNLRYTLIDLDPNDNITPNITFTTAGFFDNAGKPGALSGPQATATLSTFDTNINHPEFYRADAMINDGIAVSSSDLLPSSDHTVMNAEGLSAAAIGSNYLETGSRISDADVAALKVSVLPDPGLPDISPMDTPLWQLSTATRIDVGATGVQHVIRQVNTIIDDSDPNNIVWGESKRVFEGSFPTIIDGRHRFELSPNTQVIFEGTVTSSISRQLSNASFLSATEDIQAGVSANGLMSVRLYDLPEGHATEWPDYAAYEHDLKLQSDSSGVGANYGRIYGPSGLRMLRTMEPLPLDLSRSLTEDLRVSFSNDGSTTATGVVSLTSATSANLFALPAVVPEPSSFLLTSLGLLGLAAAASRRRQSSMPNS
jgi:PEP-CTERM motif